MQVYITLHQARGAHAGLYHPAPGQGCTCRSISLCIGPGVHMQVYITLHQARGAHAGLYHPAPGQGCTCRSISPCTGPHAPCTRPGVHMQVYITLHRARGAHAGLYHPAPGHMHPAPGQGCTCKGCTCMSLSLRTRPHAPCTRTGVHMQGVHMHVFITLHQVTCTLHQARGAHSGPHHTWDAHAHSAPWVPMAKHKLPSN